jgi:hypothetical protein
MTTIIFGRNYIKKWILETLQWAGKLDIPEDFYIDREKHLVDQMSEHPESKKWMLSSSYESLEKLVQIKVGVIPMDRMKMVWKASYVKIMKLEFTW